MIRRASAAFWTVTAGSIEELDADDLPVRFVLYPHDAAGSDHRLIIRREDQGILPAYDERFFEDDADSAPTEIQRPPFGFEARRADHDALGSLPPRAARLPPLLAGREVGGWK